MNYDKQPHIKLDQVDKVCFLSGNPDRVPVIASELLESRQTSSYRGLISYKGKTPEKNIPVTVLTTGMGAPSTAIVVEEAYRAGGRIFIRIGSCGALQSGNQHGISSIYIPHAAVRDEGTSRVLVPLEYPAVASPILHSSLCNAAKELQIDFHRGVVWTADIYYPPEDPLFRKWAKYGANCVEMESSLLFIQQALKHDMHVATILTADGNLMDKIDIYSGDSDTNFKNFRQGVQNTVKIAISAINSLNGNISV